MNRIVVIFLCVFLVTCSSYQKVGTNLGSEIEDETDAIQQHRSASRRIMFNAYRDYVNAATFRDTSNHVTENSIFDFTILFESNAKIFNDLKLFPDKSVVNADTYAGIVSSYLKRNGVLTEFETPDINDFFSGMTEQFRPEIDQSDPDDYIYYYSYVTTKKNYNILNKNNQELIYDEPMIYPIEITFRISIKNQQADIVSILLDKSK